MPLISNAADACEKLRFEAATGQAAGSDAPFRILIESDKPSLRLSVEDNGVGSDPEVIRAVLAGENATDSVGMGNVDARLRQAFGDQHGLVVETAPGAGTKVSFRVPKFAPGIRAGQ